MSGEPTTKDAAKAPANKPMIEAAKACFDGTLGSGIRYTDGRPAPKPSEAEKTSCAATEIGKAAKNRGVTLDDSTLDVLVDEAKAAYSPKPAKPKGRGH